MGALATAFGVSIVAVITGFIALRQIKRTGSRGRGLAIAGVVLGCCGIVTTIVIALVLWLTPPGVGRNQLGSASTPTSAPGVSQDLDCAAGT